MHADPGLRSISLQLRWHHQFQFAGYYVARELGFYRNAGLDVEIRAGGDVSPLREVVDQRATFGIDGSGLLVARDRGEPVVAVAAIFQKSALRLLTRGDSDIESIYDLAGRRVMLLPGYRSLALIALLDQTGMLNRIERVDSSTDVSDLIDGRVAAFNGYVSNEPFLMQQAGVGARLFDPAAYGIQFYGDVLFTHEETARSDPELVRTFLEATRRGWVHALDNPAYAIRVIREQYGGEKSAEHLAFEAEGVRESIMADVVEIGHMSSVRWSKIRDQLAGLGLVSSKLDIQPFLFDAKGSGIDWNVLQPYLLGALALLGMGFAFTAYVIRKNVQLRDEIESRQAAERHAQHLATHDYLTGLPNRMLLMDRLRKSLARAERHHGTPLLAFVDLDHFKQLNDRYGHERGDRLLREIANQVTRVIRSEDTFARMGGDEFVLLIDDMPPQLADTEAKRLLIAVQAAMADPEVDLPVGASIGVLSIGAPAALEPDSALRIADELMYEVKRGPRNSYKVAHYAGPGGQREPGLAGTANARP